LSLTPDLIKKQKDAIAQGYRRVLEKIKDLRQGYSKAVISGTRSGSGKLVYQHFEALKNIWGGSANTKPLPTGVDTGSVNSGGSDINDALMDDDDTRDENIDENINNIDEEQADSPDENPVDTQQVVPSLVKTNHVQQLIDNKRKHLERNLSAAQRDSLLLKEAKEDRKERKDFMEIMKNSNDTLATALTNLSQSMLNISASIAQSTQLMARTFELNDNANNLNSTSNNSSNLLTYLQQLNEDGNVNFYQNQ